MTLSEATTSVPTSRTTDDIHAQRAGALAPGARVVVRDDVPVLDWLAKPRKKNRKAYAEGVARIELLRDLGHELKRPHVGFLGDGIYELRYRLGTVNYWVLYFFHGQGVAVLAAGLTKEAKVPQVQIDRAIARKKRFEANPDAHKLEVEL